MSSKFFHEGEGNPNYHRVLGNNSNHKAINLFLVI